ncbi:GntR family transcriptional regulator [Youhaiella tibetensis]|nr:GntR family transcriptional regulator [Youhaiella tibetensis]AKR58358.1 GntR family transcriptional regulator [Devosia sp. H5989]GGF35064.1 GntR family transcriptional regulator [Youhaiella tibetensis]
MNDLRKLFEIDAASVAVEGEGEPQARKLVRERVFEQVRNAIVEGRIAPGTRLTERELCEAFGISRTVVREIVRRLEAEKLADVIAHRGLTVATLSRKRVEEIYEIRTELEAIAVRSFLKVATDEDIEVAREYGEKLLDAGQRGDKVGMAEIMSSFLRFMAETGDNRIAGEILEQLRTRINMLRVLAMAEPGQLETGMEGVRAIIAGIVARDLEASENATRVYVRRSGEAVLRHMDREG